jgi:hypothetical protein
MRKFERNRSYSRSEIHDALGGSVQAYLPTVGNVVVAGCFRRDTNPDAPAIVLPGNGPGIRKSAELFASAPEAVPVFIKHGVNDWRYVGDCVSRLSQDPSEIRFHAQRAGRHDVSCVLHLSKMP